MNVREILTPDQCFALQQVEDLLDKHFDQWTFGIEVDLDKKESLTFWTGRWGGRNASTSRAIGLLASQLREEQNERSSKGETNKEPRRIGFEP